MKTNFPRRNFLKSTAAAGAWLGLADLGFLAQLPSVSAADARLNPNLVRVDPQMEPLVRLLEDTPRERLLEEVGQRVQNGLSYRELLCSLLLAGVRNIQPRPVGFKFHAVLVINAAHQASLASPDSDRWLPIFWALDAFKDSQARNRREGDWTMSAVDEKAVPSADKARAAFVAAMDNWDPAATDVAVAGLARSAGANEMFEMFCRYGVRDFREIGHKAIYVANTWRTLSAIGWQHAEPILRSLAYAILDHEGENPAKRDASPDRPWRRNLDVVGKIRSDWLQGKPDPAATRELLNHLRVAGPDEASDKVIALLNRGVATSSLWDALFQSAGELVMRAPGIVPMHAMTSTNAIHFAFQHSGNDETRRLLLLQNAAFLTLFRGNPTGDKGVKIDTFDPAPGVAGGQDSLADIFSLISSDRPKAAAEALAWLQREGRPQDFMHQARRLIFLKGRDAHDYKFSAAVLEDYQHLSPAVRDRYLASSVFRLRGAGDTDNDLVRRTRAALKA